MYPSRSTSLESGRLTNYCVLIEKAKTGELRPHIKRLRKALEGWSSDFVDSEYPPNVEEIVERLQC
jgi:hypothetical protein